jgi:hypothetical protein
MDDSHMDTSELMEEPPVELQPPDWEYHRQRGAGSIWTTTLLTMNIHPSQDMKKLLREPKNKELHKEYLKRLRIITARVTIDFDYHRDHPNGGKTPTTLYVDYEDILNLALKYEWTDIGPMKEAFKVKPSDNLDDLPMTLEEVKERLDKRLENNYLRIMHHLFSAVVDNYDRKKTFSSAKAIKKWFEVGELKCPHEQSLADYVRKINILISYEEAHDTSLLDVSDSPLV